MSVTSSTIGYLGSGSVGGLTWVVNICLSLRSARGVTRIVEGCDDDNDILSQEEEKSS